MGVSLTVRLGRGTTVETFAAVLEHAEDRLDVVVKRPRPELQSNTAFLQAFEAWGRAQVELDHPNLVGILEAGMLDGSPFVIQEQIEGASLCRVLSQLKRTRRSFRPDMAVAIAKELAAGLTGLHASMAGAHGGVDPSEVLIAFDGQVKLGDQGLHRLDWVAGSTFKQGGVYLAPELQKDAAEPKKPADVYALGLITLEVLIGQPVWTAPAMSVEAALDALTDLSHVGAANPALTADLIDLLGDALDPDPQGRPTASALWERLGSLVARHDLSHKPKALGAFVRALLPARNKETAPTMVADAAQTSAGAGAEIEESRDEVKLATVLIDPDLEKKALARVGAREKTVPRGRDRASSKALEPKAPARSSRGLYAPDNVEVTVINPKPFWVIGIALLLVLFAVGGGCELALGGILRSSLGW